MILLVSTLPVAVVVEEGEGEHAVLMLTQKMLFMIPSLPTQQGSYDLGDGKSLLKKETRGKKLIDYK
jgi:hypothetical protein